jgi:rhodanese-related sulfurtransferase
VADTSQHLRQLRHLQQSGLVAMLDVRPPEEYTCGHLAGAINIALSREA